MAVRRFFGQQRDLAHNRAALALEIIGDRAAQAQVSDPMRAVSLDRQIAAGKLVGALRAGLDARKPVRDRELDGLVVANLEMQERVLLDRPPIAAVERIRADHVQRARHVAPGALGEHQEQPVGHRRPEQAEAAPVEIGRAPFARAGVHVEGEERVPMRLAEVAARDPFDLDAAGHRLAPFLTDRLPLARDERA